MAKQIKTTKQKAAATGLAEKLAVATTTQVTGIIHITGNNEYPYKGLQFLAVKFFQVTLSAETLLQAVAVDEKGLFNTQITVAPNTTIMARLYLRADPATQQEILIAESGPHCPGGEVIALSYDYDPSKYGPPLYVAIKDAVAPHLGGMQLTALTEKQKEQLSCMSGIGISLLNRMIQAAKLLVETQLAFNACNQNNQTTAKGKSPDAAYFKQAAAGMKTFTNENVVETVLFALIQNDNSMELHQVLTLSSGQLTQKVNDAVAANVIAPIDGTLLVNLVFIFLRNCLLFNSQNDNRYYDAKLIALTKLDMNSKSILLDHTIEAGGLSNFLSGQNQTNSSPTLASA